MQNYIQMGSFSLSSLNSPYNLGNHREEATQKLHKDLKIIAHSRWVQVNQDHGDFEEIGIIKWIFENIKGILGFVDHTKREVLRFRLQQLLAQATEKGLLTKEDCFGPKKLATLIEVGLMQGKSSPKDAKEISDFIKTLLQKVVQPSENKPDLNDFVERYRVRHMQDIQPHSLPWKIAYAWQKQTGPLEEDEDDEWTKWEFESSKEQDPTEKQTESLEGVAPFTNETRQEENKSYGADFLEKISKTDDLRDELEKLAFSPEINYQELYLHYLIADSLQKAETDAFVNQWISDTLSFADHGSHQWLQNANHFDRILQALDFKNSLALLTAGYRLALLVKNQEEKQLHPSNQIIKQCILAKEAFGSRLKTLIDSHQKEFQNLHLTNFSPKELRFYKDSLSYQFFNLLSDQIKLRKAKENTTDWFINAGMKLMSAGAILGVAGYALKHFTNVAPPLPPPEPKILFPTFTDRIVGLGFTAAIVVVAGITFHCLYNPQTNSPKKKIPKKSDPKRIKQVKDLLASATDITCFNWMGNFYQPTKDISVSCHRSHTIIDAKSSQDNEFYTITIKNNEINPFNENPLALFNHNGKNYLIINFETNRNTLTCCVCLKEIDDSDPTSLIESIDIKQGSFQIKFNAPATKSDSSNLLTPNNEPNEVIQNIQQFINLTREKLAENKSNELSEEHQETAALLDELQQLKLCLEQIDLKEPSAKLKFDSLVSEAQLIIEKINHLIQPLTAFERFAQMWDGAPDKYYIELRVTYQHLIEEAPKVLEQNELAADNLKAALNENFSKLNSHSSIEKLKEFEKWIYDVYLVEYSKLMPPLDETQTL